MLVIIIVLALILFFFLCKDSFNNLIIRGQVFYQYKVGNKSRYVPFEIKRKFSLKIIQD